MTHARQHSGWATAARRRGEEFLRCLTCGGPRHPRPRYQAEPIEHEEPEQWGPVKLGVVVVFAIGFIVVLGLMAGISEVPA